MSWENITIFFARNCMYKIRTFIFINSIYDSILNLECFLLFHSSNPASIGRNLGIFFSSKHPNQPVICNLPLIALPVTLGAARDNDILNFEYFLLFLEPCQLLFPFLATIPASPSPVRHTQPSSWQQYFEYFLLLYLEPNQLLFSFPDRPVSQHHYAAAAGGWARTQCAAAPAAVTTRDKLAGKTNGRPTVLGENIR